MLQTRPDILAANWLRQGNAHVPQAVADLQRALPDWTFISGDGWMLGASQAECLARSGNTHVAMTLGQVFDRASAKLMNLPQIAARIATDLTAQDAFAPPYRLFQVNRERGKVETWFDDCGLGHVFSVMHRKIEFLSSSARLLARLTGSPPNTQALAAYSQLGLFPFESTPFEGVTKLLPRDPFATGFADKHSPTASVPTIEALAEAMRDVVAAMLKAAPNAVFELSGGLDSRLILAAMPTEVRASRIAMTLHDPASQSDDLRIAEQIVRQQGLRHNIRRLDTSCYADRDRFFRLIDAANNDYECMGNPVDKVPLLEANHEETGGARFSGQNGEILRGFFHALQPLETPASTQLIKRLVDWRLVANDRVSNDLLAGGNSSEARTSGLHAICGELSAFEGAWGKALDRIYLRLRMQAWVGNATSANLHRRTMLMPFFDREFLDLALALPARQKSDSAAAYRLLAALDPALAALPLDNGVVPIQQIQPGTSLTVTRFAAKARKLGQRIRQRLAGNPGMALGGSSVVNTWHRFDGHLRLDFDGLDRLGILAPRALEQVSRGEMLTNRADLGFMLICDSVVRNR